MLYLNLSTLNKKFFGAKYLTLTNVVFECSWSTYYTTERKYLTLTNVVFEFVIKNRAKSDKKYLTLTNVVFEFTL